LALILIAIAIIYAALMSYFSFLRYTDFYTSNWDLGIAMQSLWTNTHGYLLYESGDYESFGVLSFLQIHSTYTAIPISYIYGIYPSPLTLFIIQSVFVTLSVVPIYFISKKAGLSASATIFIVLLFLLNFSIISGILYDFHWESLIPVEFFTLFLLVLEKRYYLSLGVFAIGCMTLEIFPFILVGVIFYFFLTKYLPGSNKTSLWTDIPNSILLSFLLIAIFSYFLIRYAQYDLIPLLVHEPINTGKTVSTAINLFSFHISLSNISESMLYWFMIILTLGMLPLFSPKLLLIAAPWVFYTFFLAVGFTTAFGNQDSLLTTPYAMLASISGLAALRDKDRNFYYIMAPALIASAILFVIPIYGNSLSYNLLSVLPPRFYYGLIVSLIIPAIFVLYLKFRTKPIKIRHLLNYFAVFACALIALNLVMSPLNVENFQATPFPGYSFTYTVNPEFSYAREIAGLIPPNSTVVASDNLFPLVANNRNAYALPWVPFSDGIVKYLPFNNSVLPDYILVDQSSFNLPQFLNVASTNISEYGIYAYTFSNQFPGSIALYKLNDKFLPVFTGKHTPLEQVFNYSNLDVGSAGHIVQCKESTPSEVITGQSNAVTTGTIWYGPYTTISPGNYSLNISYMIRSSNLSVGKQNVLLISGWVYHGITIFNKNVTYTPSNNGKWQSLTINFSLKTLVLDAQFSGYLLSFYDSIFTVYLSSITLKAN